MFVLDWSEDSVRSLTLRLYITGSVEQSALCRLMIASFFLYHQQSPSFSRDEFLAALRGSLHSGRRSPASGQGSRWTADQTFLYELESSGEKHKATIYGSLSLYLYSTCIFIVPASVSLNQFLKRCRL